MCPREGKNSATIFGNCLLFVGKGKNKHKHIPVMFFVCLISLVTLKEGRKYPDLVTLALGLICRSQN